ncbi:MAG TPA: hypothetical protein VD736_09345 [Nitrososphaera sp.]|nr:hypothetical protein [Nitrososphaera sp.]
MRRKSMFKVIGLIVAGIFLASFGVYSVMNANWPVLQLPNVNWGLSGSSRPSGASRCLARHLQLAG